MTDRFVKDIGPTGRTLLPAEQHPDSDRLRDLRQRIVEILEEAYTRGLAEGRREGHAGQTSPQV